MSTPIATRYVSLSFARLVRSVGYRGPHISGVLSIAVLVSFCVVSFAATGIANQAATAAGNTPGIEPVILSMTSLVLYFACGPLILLVDTARSRDRHARNVLGSLPISRRALSVVGLLPAAALGAYGLALVGTFTVIVMNSANRSTIFAISLTVVTALCGIVHAVLLLTTAKAVFGGASSWSAAGPVAMLGWLGLTALIGWRTVQAMASTQVAVYDQLLIVPGIARTYIVEGTFPWLVTAVLVVVAAPVLYIWGTRESGAGATTGVQALPRWHRHGPLPLVRLELRRTVRSPVLMANAASSTVLALGIAIALRMLPDEVVSRVGPGTAQAAVILLALPLVLIRGQSPTHWPPQLSQGFSWTRWTAAWLVTGAGIFTVGCGVLAVPLLLNTGLPIMSFVTAVAGPGLLGVVTFLALGTLLPASPDNPLAQMVTAIAGLTIVGVLAAATSWLVPGQTPAWWALHLVLVLGLALVPFGIEHYRLPKTLNGEPI